MSRSSVRGPQRTLTLPARLPLQPVEHLQQLLRGIERLQAADAV